ncbi:MAG: DNA/RNA nuclease SfsA [Candidatus Lokiarchaeota archaeon]|nr:DNA/RNA nuclease SfsA [Candidatus Lokiarchaeota archaeon]MBD3340767.1 DNA/RNA nuclease SfsA [Candidatus Lokiarchaeota archaeon]
MVKSDSFEIFKLPNLKKGTFVSRLNRFVGEIKYNNEVEMAHIHDPGRLTELLVKGIEVLFTHSRGKLKYYIKAVRKEDEWVLIDSALHSRIALKVIKLLKDFSGVKKIKKEVPLGNSRIDFFLDKTPLEVKGCTLVKNEIALFPDAPTKRGARHVKEIIAHEGIILFLILRKAKTFAPNWETDPEFSSLLSKAKKQGIKILAVQIRFDGKTIYYEGKVKISNF